MSGTETKVDDLGRRKYVGVTYLEILITAFARTTIPEMVGSTQLGTLESGSLVVIVKAST